MGYHGADIYINIIETKYNCPLIFVRASMMTSRRPVWHFLYHETSASASFPWSKVSKTPYSFRWVVAASRFSFSFSFSFSWATSCGKTILALQRSFAGVVTYSLIQTNPCCAYYGFTSSSVLDLFCAIFPVREFVAIPTFGTKLAATLVKKGATNLIGFLASLNNNFRRRYYFRGQLLWSFLFRTVDRRRATRRRDIFRIGRRDG